MVLQSPRADYLASILRAFKDLIFLINDAGVILDYLQNETSELLYVPKEQFIGKHHSEVLPPDVSGKIQHAVSEVRKGEGAHHFDYQLSIKGHTAWFAAVLSPFPADNGYTQHYVCVIREITERKEKELLLQGVLENAFNAFIVFRSVRNRDGIVTDLQWRMLNHKAEALLGRGLDEMKQKTVRESCASHAWILFQEYLNVASSGVPLDLEYNYQKDGATVWLRTHALKMEEHVVVTIEDITKKKQSELDLKAAMEQLTKSRLYMDLFFSQALSGFFFMMLDEPLKWNKTTDKEAAVEYSLDHLRFTRINTALLQQYGASEREIINQTLRDAYRGATDDARKLIHNLFDEGSIHVNRRTRKMDGSELWVDGYYIRYTDQEKKIVGVFGIQNDITERKEAEEALRSSEERYRLLANNMLDLVTLHDPDGTYRYLSPSANRVLGYSPEELVGTSPYALFHPDDIPQIREQSHRKAAAGEVVPGIEYRIKKKDGEYIWLSTNTKPILDKNGSVVMLQAVSRNVTERIHNMNTLKELNYQKNKLFSIIAHDLRGPLASCMGLLNLTQREVAGSELKKYLHLAQKSAFNLHELMEDLLLWAGSQLDKVSFDPAILNLPEEIEAVTRRFTDIAHAKDITIHVDVEDDSLSVLADRDMVRTIIRNLLSNAIKFTPRGGRVEIKARPKNGLIEISVCDNGVGIKKENIDKLFSKTSTFTTFGTNGEKGTGLGLDICKDFVEKHKGTIWVESEFGAGSRFVFTLKEF